MLYIAQALSDSLIIEPSLFTSVALIKVNNFMTRLLVICPFFFLKTFNDTQVAFFHWSLKKTKQP